MTFSDTPATAPNPSAPSAAEDTVRATVEIAVPPEQVFEALIDPAQLEAWWGSDETYRTSDWQVEPHPGGEWSVQTTGADGAEETVHGEYRVVDAPHVLEYTWAASWDDFTETTVRFELAPAVVYGVSGTRLTVTHTGFAALDIHALDSHSQAGATFAADWPRLLSAFVQAVHEFVVLA